MQLELNTVITIVSSFATVGAVILNNRTVMKHLEEKIEDYKTSMLSTLKMEKRHVLELAEQRVGAVEKDVNEIFPRLRTAEENVQKNCIVLKTVQRDCIRRHKEGA